MWEPSWQRLVWSGSQTVWRGGRRKSDGAPNPGFSHSSPFLFTAEKLRFFEDIFSTQGLFVENTSFLPYVSGMLGDFFSSVMHARIWETMLWNFPWSLCSNPINSICLYIGYLLVCNALEKKIKRSLRFFLSTQWAYREEFRKRNICSLPRPQSPSLLTRNQLFAKEAKMAELDDAEGRSVRGTSWSGVLELDLRWQLHSTLISP